MPVFNNVLAGAAGSGGAADYIIERSLRFDSASSSYLRRQPSIIGNTSTWSFSCWVKRTKFGVYPRMFGTYDGAYIGWDIEFNNSDQIDIHYSSTGSNYPIRRTTTAKYRDSGAWMHVVVAVDLTVTGDNSVRLWVNGLEVTEFDTKTNSSTITSTNINTATQHRIGYNYHYGDFYLADVHFLDGIAVTDATPFGEFSADTGVWNPIEFTGNHNVNVGYGGTVPTSTTNVAPAGGHGNGIATAAVLFGGTELTNGQNHIRQDGGGIEWSAAIPLSSGDVAGAKCLYFNNTSAHDIEFKINGSWVTAQTNAQNVIGSTQGQGAIITYTASGSVNWTGVRATNGSNGSVTTVAGIYVNNNLVGAGTTAANGFHLDFDPTAASQTYSTGGDDTNATNSGVGWAALFDDSYEGAYPLPNTTMSWTGNIPANGKNVRIGYRSDTYAGGSIVVNNTSTTLSSGNFYTVQWVDLGTFSADITSMSVSRNNVSFQGGLIFSYLEVDGKIVINYEPPGVDASGNDNHWTSNNISLQTAADYSTGTFSVQGGGSMLNEAQAFNGSTSNGAIQNGIVSGTNEHTWTPSSPITGVTSLRIYMRRSDASGGDSNFQYKINTGSYVNSGIAQNGSGWVTPSSVPSTLSSISLKSVISNNSSGLGINAIEVNGTILENVDGSGYDILSDTPTDNFCTLNPLSVPSQNPTLSNGNLTMTSTGVNQGRNGTLAVPFSGKWYYEVTIGSGGSGVWQMGISDSINQNNSDGARLIILSDARKQILQNGSATFASYGSGWSTGDVMACAFDADNNSLTFYKNGTSMGVAYSNVSDYLGDSITPYFQLEHSGRNFTINFGQLPWVHTPPANHNGWSTGALPNPAIKNPSKHFTTTLYSGNGSSQTITTGMPNDLVWIKCRNTANTWHTLSDSVRGIGSNGAYFRLFSNAANSENDDGYDVTALSADGFTLANGDYANASGRTYAAWTWNMGSTTQTISAGALNSSLYNQSAVWSGMLTSSNGFHSNYPAVNAFDGYDSDDQVEPAAAGGVLTFTPTTAINYTTSVEFKLAGGSKNYSVNGGSTQTSSSTGDTWTTAATGSGTLSSLAFWKSGDWPSLRAIRIDGKLLVDSNASPSNVPSLGADIRANQDAGQSIVSYSGDGSNATLPHNLSQAPELIIVKDRTSADAWQVWVKGFSSNEYLYLNLTDAKGSYSGTWGSTPTNSVFGVYNQGINQSGHDFIAYCFHSVPSFSKVGVYTGNGQSGGAGPYIPLDFRARFILLKNIDLAGSNWFIFDAARNTYNAVEENLKPNSDAQEETDSSGTLDIVSNGFQVRSNGSHPNGNGNKIIYYAIAETPGKYSRAR